MYPDKEFWKKKYGPVKWKEGNNRESIFKEMMSDLGYNLEEFGFEAMSEKYNPDSPKEKGAPDFVLKKNKKEIYFEVTGTNIQGIKKYHKLWIRPDKIEYVKTHKILGYCIHILNHLGVIRFINMSDIDPIPPSVKKNIRGTEETYCEFNPEEFTSIERLQEELASKGF